MKKEFLLLSILTLCLIFVMVLAGCGDGDNDNGPDMVLVDQDVTVPARGGTVEVSFSANSDQRILITLTASSDMEPYGYLTYPDGAREYYPPLQTAQNGTNSVEITLDQTGVYTLSIMDGTNLGGTVHVKVEVLS